MFDLTTLTAEAFGQEISAAYRNTFGGREPQRADFLAASARLAVERIANSDALYHDVHHTIMVTLVGQDILRGRIITQRVTPSDWEHFLLALLTHDIGYVRAMSGIPASSISREIRSGCQGGRRMRFCRLTMSSVRRFSSGGGFRTTTISMWSGWRAISI